MTRSEIMRARWADPDTRAKYLAACRSSIKAACKASAASPRHHKFQKGHSPSPVTERAREARRATMRALCADPVMAEKMRANRAKRWPYTAPKDPKYRLVRDVLGVATALAAFSTPAAHSSPRAVVGSPSVPGTLALVSQDMPAGTP